MFMSRYGIVAVSILLLFEPAIAEMPDRGKGATPSHPQRDISHGCERQGKGKQPQFAQGEVLVKFKSNVTRERIDGILKACGLSIIKRIESIGVYRLKIPPGSTVKEMVDALNEYPQVEYAEPNYEVRIIGK